MIYHDKLQSVRMLDLVMSWASTDDTIVM